LSEQRHASRGMAERCLRGGSMQRHSWFLLLFSLLITASAAVQACWAEPVRQDNGPIAKELSLPIYQWSSTEHPKAVVIAVHGLIMHGGCYDAMARDLAKEDCAVFAPDLRGYGRWYHQMDERSIDYAQSQEDLTRLATTVHSRYPGVPIYCIGESLGASMVLRLASSRPDLVSGLILSSPAIKSRKCIFTVPNIPAEAASIAVNCRHKIDMAPYIRRFSSEDPVIRKEILDDPLTRQSLNAFELLRTLKTVRGTMPQVAKIPQQIPILIIQGNADRTLKANAVVLLLERLRCTDQTVKWFPARGHVLLETAHLDPSMMQTISGWLNQHVMAGQPAISAAEHSQAPAKGLN
jgi:acylglycerol lipase